MCFEIKTGENGIFKSYYNRHVCYVDIIGLLVAFSSHNHLKPSSAHDNLRTQFVVPWLWNLFSFHQWNPKICDMLWVFGLRWLLRFPVSRLALFFLIFSLRVNSNFTWIHCAETKITIHALFITVYALKNIKNGSHSILHA